MSEFCDTCPLKGSCEGAIEGIMLVSSVVQGSISENGRNASFSFEGGVPQGPTDLTVKYVDSSGGASEAITVHGSSVKGAETKAVELLDDVDECTSPTKIKKVFGLVTKTECTVLKA